MVRAPPPGGRADLAASVSEEGSLEEEDEDEEEDEEEEEADAGAGAPVPTAEQVPQGSGDSLPMSEPVRKARRRV